MLIDKWRHEQSGGLFSAVRPPVLNINFVALLIRLMASNFFLLWISPWRSKKRPRKRARIALQTRRRKMIAWGRTWNRSDHDDRASWKNRPNGLSRNLSRSVRFRARRKLQTVSYLCFAVVKKGGYLIACFSCNSPVLFCDCELVMILRSYIAADCLLAMQNGTELHKVRSTSRQYARFFFLDPDLSCLRWSPSTKKPEKAKSKMF